jgi:starch synthase
VFHGVDYPSFSDAITRTINLYAQHDVWAQIQRAGMKTDFSWRRSGQAYAALYRHIAGTE